MSTLVCVLYSEFETFPSILRIAKLPSSTCIHHFDTQVTENRVRECIYMCVCCYCCVIKGRGKSQPINTRYNNRIAAQPNSLVSCQVLLLSDSLLVKWSPVMLSFCQVVFMLGHLPVLLSSCHIVFLSGCLPVKLSSS